MTMHRKAHAMKFRAKERKAAAKLLRQWNNLKPANSQKNSVAPLTVSKREAAQQTSVK